MQVVRNTIGTFRGVDLGIDNTIAYNGRPAITGHVDLLEGFQPTVQEPESPVEAPPAQIRITGGILAGRLLNKQAPIYPDDMKRQHVSGTVVLRAIISNAGKITSLEVIASPHPSLSASAVEAVKHWTYQPYLLNGEPTEVDTTITINYNLNGG
jgi:protein TonB